MIKWIIISGLIVFVSCIHQSSDSMGSDLPLSGTHWQLKEINGKAVELTGNRKDPFIRFDKDTGKVSGNTGCNDFFGTFRQEGGKFSMGPLGMTRMACKGWMETEQALAQVLDQTTAYEIRGNSLFVMNGDTIGAMYQAN